MRVNRAFTQFLDRGFSCPEGEAKLSGYEHDCPCAKAEQRKQNPQASSNFSTRKTANARTRKKMTARMSWIIQKIFA